MVYFSFLHKCFLVTLLWFAYGSCYLLRKPFGIIKAGLQDSMNVSDNLLGYLDFAFALPYALCSLLFGCVGDSLGHRRTLGCGLLGSAIASSVMGKSEKYYELCILLFISGSFQALCWPACCSILSSCFSKSNMSSAMAVYGSCMLVGSIGSSLLTITLESNSDWRNVFAVPSFIVEVIGILVLFCVRQRKAKPVDDSNQLSEEEEEIVTTHKSKKVDDDSNQLNEEEEKIITPHESRADDNSIIVNKVDMKVIEPKNKSMSVLEVLCISTVPEICIALAFSKGIKTAVMQWLPLYLMKAHKFGLVESGLIPLTFEIGGLIGSILIIVVSNKVFKFDDIPICTFSNLLCAGAFLLLMLSSKLGELFLHAMLFLAGALSYISEIILCGSLPSKIGEEVGAKSSVVGVVNGIGSLGNVIEGPIVAWVVYQLGIKFIMLLFMIFCLLCFLCMLKLYVLHIRERKNNVRV